MNASSEHRDPVNCRHAERCSGCPLIALPYEEQLAHKGARVRAAFATYRAHGELQVDAVAPAEMHTGYRVRAKLMVSTDPSGAPTLGLYARTTGQGESPHQVVDIPDCRVLSPDLLRVTAGLRALLAAPPAETEGCLVPAASGGSLTAVDLRETSDASDGRLEIREASVVLVTLVLQGPASEMALAEAARAVRTIQGVAGVAANFHREGSPQVLGPTTRVLAGVTEVRDRVTSAYHLATYGSFVQAHRAQAGRIQAMLASRLGPSLRGQKVLDLYGGSGALSLPLAALGAQVTLVESFGPAAEAAGRAAREQGIRDFAVRHGDAALVARELSRTGSTFDAVIANPPRRGLAPVVRRALTELRAPLIAYVSVRSRDLGPRSGSFRATRLPDAGGSTGRHDPADRSGRNRRVLDALLPARAAHFVRRRRRVRH